MIDSIQIFGYIASAILIARVVPQAIRSYKQKNSHGLAKSMLSFWFIGEAMMIAYVFLSVGLNIPLLLYYSVTLVGVAIILWYKLWPKESHVRWPYKVEEDKHE